MAKLCMGCMNPLPEGSTECAVCGYSADRQNPSGCLKTATLLQEHYIVGRIMSVGNDSLVYLGYNRVMKEPCFIQEYCPSSLCHRTPEGIITPASGCEGAFAEYKADFHNTVRALAQAKELPAMIPVYDIFEENNTVYAVSDYCEGMTLTRKLKASGGRLSWAEARPLFMALMSCVDTLHSLHIRHLAICPDNILISRDGKPHLRGFSISAARTVGSDLTPDLAAGFAAPEQYRTDVPVSNATDVYGLAATLFRAVTGNEPPVGNKRAKDSDDLFMPAEVAEELSQEACMALFNALQVNPANRTASVAELRDQLGVAPNISALRDEVDNDRMQEKEEEDEENASGKNRTLLIIFGTVLGAMLVIALILLLIVGSKSNKRSHGDTSTPLPTVTTTTTTGKKAKQFSVPALVGESYYDVRNEELEGDMTITVKYMKYSKEKAGTILEQEPEAGKSVPKETEIVVVLSAGKNDEVKVPDVSGWPQEYAKPYLEALGFKVEVALLQASEYEKGQVEGTDPEDGTVLHIGDTVTLRVSDVEPVKEPDDNQDGYDDYGYGDDDTGGF